MDTPLTAPPAASPRLGSQTDLGGGKQPRETVSMGPVGLVGPAPALDVKLGVGQAEKPMHSSRSLPLKLSMWAFCAGCPGWMRQSSLRVTLTVERKANRQHVAPRQLGGRQVAASHLVGQECA